MIFQTMVADLMALDVANASLLDEATAVAEAVALVRRQVKTGSTVVVDKRVYPSSIDVLRTRCEAQDITVILSDDLVQDIHDQDPFCVVVAHLGVDGELRLAEDCQVLCDAAHNQGALVVATSDLLAATMVRPPGTWGADVAVGSAQRFGIPLWYGGPGVGFMAVRQELVRQLPGRLVGESLDADGNSAYRLTLQTREQHIRREKATSNICTSQVLMAAVAAFYALWHGPSGLEQIASTIHGATRRFARAAIREGYTLGSTVFFDTLVLHCPGRAQELVNQARDKGIGIRLRDGDSVGITFGEGLIDQDLDSLAEVFGLEPGAVGDEEDDLGIPRGEYSGEHHDLHPVFSSYHDETSMMRYMRTLADKDYALDTGMIPLGSCTMKLNPAQGMEQISLPGFTDIHPYAPAEDTQGYRELIDQLEKMLCQVTGFSAVSFQPNAGSQGEFAGLMAIRRYHESRGEVRRTCLIPTSAHGTNAASAAMAGLVVVPVAVDDRGAIDLGDLRAKVDHSGEDLAVMMVTYPSTHGVFEDTIGDLCEIIHQGGGQVYVDGANFNALVGQGTLTKLGADVAHLNLHKTFALPHGGGGPGVGPVAVKPHLADFLPGHELLGDSTGEVASAPYGSAGILPIAYFYMAAMGHTGLQDSSQMANFSANYVSQRLKDVFPTLYHGENGLVAHECILDLRPMTARTGITVDDVAKRLIDYGFHAPTMSFPVPGTLMVEPTESESLEELNRFCEAMIAIRAEINAVEEGRWPADDNPLVNAPHPAYRLVGDWTHPYTREEAVYPMGINQGPTLGGPRGKYWPPVARIDAVYGDRNLKLRLGDEVA
jgi:glycine dehydrogenase